MTWNLNIGTAFMTRTGLAIASLLLAGAAEAALPAFNIEQRTTEPLMRADQPWENRTLGFLNVIETNGTWKCWYASIDTAYTTDDDQIYCYATSSNGVDWVKPNLGRVSYNGSTNNNIVLRGGGAGAYVFRDPQANRYRMTVIRNVAGNFVVFGKDSSNGLDWVEYPTPIFAFNADTQNACMWDVDRFRFYPRMWTGGIGTPNSYRMVGYSESTTFSNFPAPTAILSTDAMDPPNADFYNSAATKLKDNLYVMFPSAFYSINNGASGPGAETVVPHMAVSTNGRDFIKVGHAPAVPLGTQTGSFDRGSIYVGPGFVPGPRPDTYWFHYVGNTARHNEVLVGTYKGGLGRFLLTILPETDGGAVPLTFKAGLLTWLRADDLDADRNVTNNPADGTSVALWKDSNNAAAGYHGVQTNAIKRPIFRASGGPNNMPRVVFDGTNDFLELPTIAYSGWTVFMVGRMPASQTNTALAFADYGPANTFLALFRSSGAFTPFNRDGTSHTIRADDTNGWSRFAIRSAWVTNSAVNYKVTDGSNTYAGAGAAVGGYTPVTFNGYLPPMIGALPPNADNNANLELSEFLLFDHTLSNVDREDVEIYLKAKYFGNGTNPAPPAVSFTASPRSGTGSVAAVFSEYSTGTITNRFWDFGDGQTTNTTANTLVHRYTQGGSFTVTLTATGPLGTGTVTRAGYVNVTSLGGIITTNGDYRIETFIRDGIFEASRDTDIEVLLVGGGGGGGGRYGGGGGAGGLVHTNMSIPAGQYAVRVGPGGQGAVNGDSSTGPYTCLRGSNTVAFGLTAFGGGRGMSGAGASGGGGEPGVAGGVATNGQGHGGGTGVNGGWPVYLGGGGGGAGGVGGTALAPAPGTGGPGLSKAITGDPVTYAAGGAGGSWEALTQGAAGAANTGNGGGGSGGSANAGGNGGSGVVIVRYQAAPPLLIENRPATGVTTTSAWLNGFLVTNPSPATVSVYWGTVDGGEPGSGPWQATNTWPEGAWTAGSSPAYHATSLTPNRFYYYRYYAASAAGEAWASTTEGFLTAVPGANATTNAGIWNDGSIWSLGRRPVAGDAVTVNHAVLLTNTTESLSTFTITNATMTFTNWGTALHAAMVTVQDGGTLTLPSAFTTNQMSNRVWVVCSDFTIDPGGRILADARGYLTENGPGRGYYNGIHWGCGGGGYGGKGSYGQWADGGQAYGSSNAPADPGSGGGGVEAGSNAGGNGGGAVRIEADGKVTVNGTMTANGGNGARPGNMGGGGGSGGGIYITCSSFSGTGILRANGGNGIMGNGAGGGGGGGGRLAVWVGVSPELRTRYLNGEFVREVERTNTWRQFSGTFTATNGTTSFPGGDESTGTACIFSAPRPGMVLTIK